MHSNPFPSSPSRTTQPLELVHSDLHGPLQVATREGYRYWMTFIDDATSHCAAMQLKQKSDAQGICREPLPTEDEGVLG